MRPQGERVLRRERRHAWKGTQTGRRTTHAAVRNFPRGVQHDAHVRTWLGMKAVEQAWAAIGRAAA